MLYFGTFPVDAKDLDEEGNIAGLVNDDINDSSEDEEEEIVRTKKRMFCIQL